MKTSTSSIHASISLELPYEEWENQCIESGVEGDADQLHSWLLQRLISSNDLADLFTIHISTNLVQPNPVSSLQKALKGHGKRAPVTSDQSG